MAPAASALRSKTAAVLSAGKEHTFELKPFEVLVFDATPF
jgi:hypothetical protein